MSLELPPQEYTSLTAELWHERYARKVIQYNELRKNANEHIKDLEERFEYADRMASMAGRLAISLECMCLNPDKSYNEALQLVSDWHDMINEVNPMPDTFMGEPI